MGLLRRKTGTTPGDRPPRFPGYDVLAQRETWDDETAGVVLARLGPLPPPRFFAPAEEATARALVDRLLGQDCEPRVPAFELMDARLADGVGEGYRFEHMPEATEAWKRSVAGLDDDARAAGAARFSDLRREAQMDLLEAVQQTEGDWHGMPAKRVFDLWMHYVCTAFYSHPWAWNEIGFGGPAYPRGYSNLGVDKREHWERPERQPTDPVRWSERADAFKKAHAERRPMPQ
ncbi:MAG TPA: gluconate 2-dehydrogenase subunit 3 family protein [Acidimicrobiales bacterium]|nr:gluconate 2-dehydrogenase subunit 3 family protein [Acidimicrobiales bacterium]